MSRAPYAAQDLPAERRVSGLAVASLVFGLLCCIPGSGLIGVILGGAGLVRIGHSEGRLSGRTLAFIGLVLGLLGSILWVAIGLGGRQAIAAYQIRLAEPVIAAAQAMDAGDWASARKLLDPSVAKTVSDQDLKAFHNAVAEKFGAVKGPGQKVELRTLMFAQPSVTLPPGPHTQLPWPVQFDKGTGWVVIVSDSPTIAGDILMSGASIQGHVSNIGIVGDSGQVWLIDPSRKPSPTGK